MAPTTLPQVMEAPAASEAYFADFGQRPDPGFVHGGTLGPLPNRTGVSEVGEDWYVKELWISKRPPQDGDREAMMGTSRRRAARETIVRREYDALVDAFFDRIDAELNRAEDSITDAS